MDRQMTNAPVYKSQIGDRPVAQVSFRNAVTPESEGAGVGAALRGVQGATESWQVVLAARDELERDARVRTATETFRANAREVVAGPGGFMSQTGEAAMGGQREAAMDRLERSRNEVAATLPPREREAFMARTADYVVGQGDRMAEHESQQSREAIVTARNATITGLTEDALDQWDKPEVFEANLAEAVREQNDLAALQGIPPEAAARAAEELVMQTLTQKAVLMALDDPEAAMQFIENEPRLTEQAKAKITETLGPAVQQHRVDSYMSQFIVTGSTSGFVASTAQRESGGGANRQNPNSSAGGLYGYLDSTWQTSLAAAQAAGALPPEYAGKPLAELQGLKNDDVLATAVMSFDEQRYERAIAATGAPVNDVSKYMLHHFGFGAGPAMLSAMQTNPGASAKSVYDANGWNWDAVVKANPGVSYDMTVGEVYAYSGAHIGQGGGTPGQGIVQFDFAGAYAFAQTIEDPATRDAFLKQVEAREATEAKRRQAASGQVIDAATTRYFETGDANLTLAEQLTLGLSGSTAFRNMVTADQSGKLVTDMGTYSLLMEMAASTDAKRRAEFAAEGSVEKFIDKLSKDDYRAFVTERARVRAELEGVRLTSEQLERNPAMAVPVKDEHRKIIGRHLDRVGVASGADNAAPRAQAEYNMEVRLRQQMIDFWTTNKRAPTEEEVDDMLYAQTLPVSPGGTFGAAPTLMFQFDTLPDGAIPDPQVTYEAIPAQERAQLTSRLATVLGRTPTPEEVSAAYVNGRLVRGQLSPEPLDSMEVPMEVYTYGVGFLGMSEDELRLHWENYVNGVAAGVIDPDKTPFIPAP
jgi:hypothetical protein